MQPIIVASNDLFSILNDDELVSILGHEQGHIDLGHIDFSPESQHIIQHGNMKVFNNEEAEIQADAYAAKMFGARNMISALNKLIDFMIRTGVVANELAKHGITSQFAIKMAEAQAIKMLQPRLDALKAMI